MKNILYAIIVISLCASCGSLSRSKAKDEIIKNKQLPKKETAELPKKYRLYDEKTQYLTVEGFEPFSVYETKLKDFESAGYITLKEEEYMYNELGSWLIKYMNVELTDKGKQDLINEYDGKYIVKFCDLDFGEVTGIEENKSFGAADVTYTLVRNNMSEFGKKVREIKEGDANTMSFDRQAIFSKYMTAGG